MSYLTTPRYGGHSSSRSALATLLASAWTTNLAKPVRAIFDGDSQETFPGGAGSEFGFLMNYLAWKHYGNSPESQILGITAVGSGSPPAGWGVRTSSNGAAAAGSTALGRFPYYMEPGTNSRYTSSSNGWAYVLQHNGLDGPSALTEIPRTIEYIQRAGCSWKMLVPNLLGGQGPTLQWRNVQSTSGAASYFTTQTGNGTISLAAANLANSGWTEVGAAYDFGGLPPSSSDIASNYAQVIVRSNGAYQIEAGPTWFLSQNTRGVTFHSLSAGGVQTERLFADRPNCGSFLTAFAPDLVVLACGANDIGRADSAATYGAAVQAKVSAYLALLPTATLVLAGDSDRTGVVSASEWNAYEDQLAAIAAISANRAVHINRRRILEEDYGWIVGGSNFNSLCYDGVHYTTAGARAHAQILWRSILDVAGVRAIFPNRLSLSTGIGIGGATV